MQSRWLVAVDDSDYAQYAFNYCISFMNTELDHLYIMHVSEETAKVFVGYATAQLLDSFRKAADEKSRKILVHYGHQAKLAGVKTFLLSFFSKDLSFQVPFFSS